MNARPKVRTPGPAREEKAKTTVASARTFAGRNGNPTPMHSDAVMVRLSSGYPNSLTRLLTTTEVSVNGMFTRGGRKNFWMLLETFLQGHIKGSVEPFHLFDTSMNKPSCNERKAKTAERFRKVLDSVVGKRLTYALVCR